MSHLIGPRHGRSRETYQRAPGAGGTQAKIVPLTRQRFIDGGTVQPGLDGSVANPFKTIAEFMASRTNASVADANANYVGWVMPALAGYVENVAFPPYASTELRADSLSASASGTVITGNVTWPNVAGANTPAFGLMCMHNVSVNGTITVTDDVGAPSSEVVIGGDEAAFVGVSIGAFVSNAATKLGAVLFYNVLITSINAGATANSAVVILDGCELSGNATAKVFEAFDCSLQSTTITALVTAIFRDCTFTAPTVLSTTSTSASFDGSSWMSFVGIGGTRAAGTSVLVVGGFDGGAVQGAALTDASVDVTLDGVGATAGFTGENSGNHYVSSVTLTNNRAVTFETSGAKAGDTMCVSRTSNADAFTLSVLNGGLGGGTVASIPPSTRGFVVARFDGTNWIFDRGGSLAT